MERNPRENLLVEPGDAARRPDPDGPDLLGDADGIHRRLGGRRARRLLHLDTRRRPGNLDRGAAGHLLAAQPRNHLHDTSPRRIQGRKLCSLGMERNPRKDQLRRDRVGGRTRRLQAGMVRRVRRQHARRIDLEHRGQWLGRRQQRAAVLLRAGRQRGH